MYILRMISGVLHQEVGPAVPEAALDLRPGELAVVVPLVGILLALSAWPAAISERAFARDQPSTDVATQFRATLAPPSRTHVELILCPGNANSDNGGFPVDPRCP
jgi:hypothetical protein